MAAGSDPDDRHRARIAVERLANDVGLRLVEETTSRSGGGDGIALRFRPPEALYRSTVLLVEINSIKPSLHEIVVHDPGYTSGIGYARKGGLPLTREFRIPARRTQSFVSDQRVEGWEPRLERWLGSVLVKPRTFFASPLSVNEVITLHLDEAMQLNLRSIAERIECESHHAWLLYYRCPTPDLRHAAAVRTGAVIEVLQEFGHYEEANDHLHLLFQRLGIAESGRGRISDIGALYESLSEDAADSIACSYLHIYRPDVLSNGSESYFEEGIDRLHDPTRKSEQMLRLWMTRLGRQTEQEFDRFRLRYERCAKGKIDTAGTNVMGSRFQRALLKSSQASRTVDKMRFLEDAYRHLRLARGVVDSFRIRRIAEANMITHVLINVAREEVDLLRRIATLRLDKGQIAAGLRTLAASVDRLRASAGITTRAVSSREYNDLCKAMPRIPRAAGLQDPARWVADESLDDSLTAIDKLLVCYQDADDFAERLGCGYA